MMGVFAGGIGSLIFNHGGVRVNKLVEDEDLKVSPVNLNHPLIKMAIIRNHMILSDS